MTPAGTETGMRRQVGLVGVGLMGHGIARNILKHGHALAVMDHPGNRPLDELRAAGVVVRADAEAVARDADVLILCVTGSPEVEAVLAGETGALAGLRPGAVVVDCSTALPEETARMARLVAEAGGRFVDAPMTRTAAHAHEGRLNLLVGAEPGVLEEIRPVLACFAETVVHTGPVGTGHRMKLLHNFVSLGTVTLIAEAAACAERAGVAADVFVDVLTAGGGSGAALDRLRPYILAGDASGLQFAMSNAVKDLTYYARMAAGTDARHAVADAVAATLREAVAEGGPGAMVPELVSILARR